MAHYLIRNVDGQVTVSTPLAEELVLALAALKSDVANAKRRSFMRLSHLQDVVLLAESAPEPDAA